MHPVNPRRHSDFYNNTAKPNKTKEPLENIIGASIEKLRDNAETTGKILDVS
jgi:hypothetical protein